MSESEPTGELSAAESNPPAPEAVPEAVPATEPESVASIEPEPVTSIEPEPAPAPSPVPPQDHGWAVPGSAPAPQGEAVTQAVTPTSPPAPAAPQVWSQPQYQPDPQFQTQTQPQFQTQPQYQGQPQAPFQTQPQFQGQPQPPFQTQPAQPFGAPPAPPYYGPPFPQQGYPGQVLPDQYLSGALLAAPPPKKKRNTKRILWISTAAVVVVALVAVGVIALKPGRTGNSAVAKVTCQPTDLTTCLIKAPAGAVELAGTADSWSHETTPSAELYQPIIAQDAQGIGADTTSQLSADGMRKIVHADWNAVDGNDVDLVLLQFGTQKGAQSWNSTRSAEILAAYRGKAISIPADSTSKAYAATAVDAQGNIDAAYSTVVGDLVLNVTYSSPKQLSAQDLQTWAGTELASIRTAPPAAADPAPTAPGTEQITCGAQLTACLTPMPPGGERWTDPISKLWVKSTSLTENQFVQLQWSDAAYQQSVLTGFSADGVTGIDHDDWATDNADKQADIYLVQTITASGAAQVNQAYFGEPDWGTGITSVSFTIPGESGAQAWYSSKKDSDGFTDVLFNDVVGNVAVYGLMFFHGSFDSSTATTWAQSELNLVTQNSSTQPMGLFPLTAPTLPAATQGSCPASGDCLLPLPAGATDTTSSSYVAAENLDASSYADQYEPSLTTDDITWLQSDGFTNGVHRSWTAANGATVDAVLLKYGNSAQAQAATLLDYGTNAQSNRVCTDAAVPDSMCLASTVNTTDYLQDETIRILAWKGDYEVSISLTVSNEADVADAYAYAQQQLDMLPAS